MTFFRILTILRTIGRYRLDRCVPPKHRSFWLSFALLPFRVFPTPTDSTAASLRQAIEELGPIFIKFGQILSTRKDLFSEEFSSELEKLQDRVPPFDSGTAHQIIEASLGRPIEDVFETFSIDPMASASVAQVHAATLQTAGMDEPEAVVVKVIRPGIEKIIRRDISLMFLGAKMLERFWPEARRLHPVTVVEDYEFTILDELDLKLEADNAKRLRENWLDSGKLYVPRIYDNLSSSNVMVIERIYGITATNIKALNDRGVDLKKLAHLGVEIFFTQVFEDNFFHADMHPGNVFVDATDPANPTYIALDCAIVGSLTENDKNYLAKNIFAFFNRDYDEVAKLHIKSGWVPPDTDVQEFSRVIRKVCDPFFHKPIKEISFGIVLLELFQTARKFNMEAQPQLVLLQKTLINIEGMGRQIYPDLDLWETAAPFMERWMSNRIGVSGIVRRLAANAPRWLDQLPEIPDLAYDAMQEIQGMVAQNRYQTQTLNEVKQALEAQHRRSKFQRLGGIALIAALISLMAPASGYAAPIDPALPASVLGSLGIYWMYIHT